MPLAVPDSKSLQVEQPYLASSSPAILPSSNGNRPHSASSTTSSIIMHQSNDGISDRESLIKPIDQLQSRPTADIDNLYEEIKEQQQQTAIALGLNGNTNPYLESKKNIFFKERNLHNQFVIIMRYFIMNVQNKSSCTLQTHLLLLLIENEIYISLAIF